MSSTFKVQLMSIDRIEEHPNADRLEIAHLKGWQCIVRKALKVINPEYLLKDTTEYH